MQGIFGTGAGTSDAVPSNTTVAVLQAATQQLHVENHQYKEKLAAAQAELDVLRRVAGSGPNAAVASGGGGDRDDAAMANLYLELERSRAELATLTTAHTTTKLELSKSKEELQSAMCDLAVARREVAQQQRTLMSLQQPAGALHMQLAAFLDTLMSSDASATATQDAAPAGWATFEAKMREEGLGDHAIASFRNNYQLLVSGATGMLPEASLRPVTDLPRLQDLQRGAHDPALLGATVCLKLNGGLGTGMGLEKAKSLLAVKDGLTFLDFIALQILHLREQHKHDVKFVLMNSFATSDDTRAALAKYPELHAHEFIQNKVPKVDADSLQPASWAAAAAQEWCPPGHGDLYAAIAGSGTLNELLAAGYKYLFVSNSDNLGATLDLDILTYFAQSDTPFMMEVCERTASDKKGGHLARRAADGKLVLRESAQCAKEDEAAFQDISTHRFFNTNNLWVRLDFLQAKLHECGGLIPLPMIKNVKTVDPRDKTSPKVFQLETAMGAAIESFDGAAALVVPRTRFAPVKTTADLLALRSDVYEVTSDHRLQLIAGRDKPPTISLDDGYKLVDQLEAAFGATGAPSLRECSSVTIRGAVVMDSAKVVLRGDVTLTNPQADTRATLPDGVYSGATTLPL